jgi:hypothetical protein
LNPDALAGGRRGRLGTPCDSAHKAGRVTAAMSTHQTGRPPSSSGYERAADGHSHSHSTSRYLATRERTGWTTHLTWPARRTRGSTPRTMRGCLVIRCPPAPTGLRASDLPATAPHTTSHPISLSSIRPATRGSIERSEVPCCPPNGPTIDGKDGVGGSIPAGGSTARLTSANAGCDAARGRCSRPHPYWNGMRRVRAPSER